MRLTFKVSPGKNLFLSIFYLLCFLCLSHGKGRKKKLMFICFISQHHLNEKNMHSNVALSLRRGLGLNLMQDKG